MTREGQKEYNAQFYPASVLKWLNETTDRAFNIFEKIRICENCKYIEVVPINLAEVCRNKSVRGIYGNRLEVNKDFGCNKWEKNNGND